MAESAKMNVGLTSGDGISTEHKLDNNESANLNNDTAYLRGAKLVGGKETESIVIDLGSLTESDLIIDANNDYDVTDEDDSFSSQTKLIETEKQRMNEFAAQMIENVIGGANEKVSTKKSKLGKDVESVRPSEHFDDSTQSNLEHQPLGVSQMSSFVNISTLAENENLETDASSNTVTKTVPLGGDQETNDTSKTLSPDDSNKGRGKQHQLTAPDRVDSDDSKQSWEVISDSLLATNVTQTTSIGSSTLNVSVEVPTTRPRDEQLAGSVSHSNRDQPPMTTRDAFATDDDNARHDIAQSIPTPAEENSQFITEPVSEVSTHGQSKEETVAADATCQPLEPQSPTTDPDVETVAADATPQPLEPRSPTTDTDVLPVPGVSAQEQSKEKTVAADATPQPLEPRSPTTDTDVLPVPGVSAQEQSKEGAMAAESTGSGQPSKKMADFKTLEGNIEQAISDGADSGSSEQIPQSENSTQDGSREHDQTETEDSSQKNSEPTLEKKSEEWVDILGNGLLRKKVLREGEGITTRPVREKEIVVKYVAKLKDNDQVVDSNDNLSLILGDQDSLDLFDIVCALMQKGETSLIISDAKYAYGDIGKPPRIPPNATMEFEIQLLQVNEGPYSADMDLEKRLAWADRKRDQGNRLYSSHKYPKAAMVYMKACKALEKGWLNEDSKEARIRINELRLRCYNNLTVAHMKSAKWREALHSCRAAEKLDQENVKTLFRKGKILCELGELERGVRSLKKSLGKEPENKTISSELSKQTKKFEKQTAKNKRMYQKMFRNVKGKKNETVPVSEKSWLSNNWARLIGGSLAVGVVLVGIYAAQKM